MLPVRTPHTHSAQGCLPTGSYCFQVDGNSNISWDLESYLFGVVDQPGLRIAD